MNNVLNDVTNAVNYDGNKTYSVGTIKLKQDNFIILRDEITGLSSSRLINELIKFQPGQTVYIYILSGGGSVMSGMSVVRAINSLVKNGVDVRCVADTAMSM